MFNQGVDQQPDVLLFRRNTRSMHYLGVWTTSSSNGCHSNIIIRAAIIEQMIETIVLRIIGIWVTRYEGDIGTLFIRLGMIAYTTASTSVVVRQLYQLQPAEELVTRLEKLSDPKLLEDDYQRSIFYKNKAIIDKFAMLVPCWVVYLAIASSIAIPICIYRRTLPSVDWYPYDIKEFPYLELTILAHMFGAYLIGTSIISIGLHFLTASLAITLHFQILQYQIRNIRELALTELSQNKPNLEANITGDLDEELCVYDTKKSHSYDFPGKESDSDPSTFVYTLDLSDIHKSRSTSQIDYTVSYNKEETFKITNMANKQQNEPSMPFVVNDVSAANKQHVDGVINATNIQNDGNVLNAPSMRKVFSVDNAPSMLQCERNEAKLFAEMNQLLNRCVKVLCELLRC